MNNNKYRGAYHRASHNPDDFWREQALALPWLRAPETILAEGDDGRFRWFPDASTNTAWLALDRHVEQGRGALAALIYDSPVTGQKATFTYAELTDAVALCAGMLRDHGVVKGDRVLIYMPMIPEAVIAMLACARLGAVHSVVFGGFAANELAQRIDDAQPRLILSASCGIEVDKLIAYKPILDKALRLAEYQVQGCIVLQRPQLAAELQPGRDHDWHEALLRAGRAAPVAVAATDPLYILYTSGTTGKAKGVVRDNGGHAVALHYSMQAIYDVGPGDVFWAASDVGWVVGHSYIVYGPLLAGCTTVLYEGKPVRTPDAGAFWRVCEEYRVKVLFAAPTAFRAIRKEDPDASRLADYDLSALERLYVAGERLDPATGEWLQTSLRRPVLDHWWQTETGWAIAGNPAGLELLPCKPGSATVPMPGYRVEILDDEGHPVAAGVQGNICIRLPLPPGCLSTIWNNPGRFHAGYLEQFPGYYQSGDGGYLDEDGYLFVMGRTDDIINVAGHRLSTGEMEAVVAAHPAVAECAVIGVGDAIKGQVPMALVVIKDGQEPDADLMNRELVQRVRDEIGPLACFQQSLFVKRLPKTRSGKILRRVLRQIAMQEPFSVPSTIDDPTCLEEIGSLLRDKVQSGEGGRPPEPGQVAGVAT